MEQIYFNTVESLEVEKRNFVCRPGDSFPINLAFVNAEGEAVDVSDWEIHFVAKPFPDMADDHADAFDAELTIDDGPGGEASESAPFDDTAELSGVFFFRFYYIDENGKQRTFLSGQVLFSNDISGAAEANLQVTISNEAASVEAAGTLRDTYRIVPAVTANGVVTNFPTLNAEEIRANSELVLVNGVPAQVTVEYTVAVNKKSINFVTAPADGYKVELRYVKN